MTQRQQSNVLDEDTGFIEGIIDKISQLRVLKEELEKKHREIEARHNRSLEQRMTQVQEQMKHLQSSSPTDVASIWSSSSNLGPMKPPQYDIRTFSREVFRWQKFGVPLIHQYTRQNMHLLTSSTISSPRVRL